LFYTNILTPEITPVIDKELIYIMCLLECCVDASVMPIYGKLCILDIKYCALDHLFLELGRV
jgi:hypothetical protein